MPTPSASAVPVPPSVDYEALMQPVAAAEPLHSQKLFGKQRELLIEHAGCLYRLRITQNNKLILTK